MSNIEETAISNYQVNMEYFKENQKALHSKLLALESLIGDGIYPQKYDLEYKDNYFDIIELSSGSYLYNQDSDIFSDELTNNITFKKNDQVFETFYNYKFTDKALQKIKDADATTKHATMAPIIDYYDTHISTSMSMNKIYKFIFLGTGLGLHLPKIINKLNVDIILIVEDNIELFRLSLFTCNYKDTLKNSQSFFAIAQNYTEFSETFNAFYINAFVRNQYLKFSLFSSAHNQKIKDIQTLILSRPEIAYPHEFLLYKNIKVLDRITKSYKFLDLSKKEDENFFIDKPILIVAAGPSLHANLDWLSENKNQFVLVVAFAALKTINKLGIQPDIVIQIDEKATETINLVKSFDNFKFLDNSIFIFNASVPDILFDTFDSDKIYLLEDRTKYKLNNTHLEASSVGESAYAISLIFNANNIYLLGLDLALADDGTTHAKDHHAGSTLDVSVADKVQKVASMDSSVSYVKGNFRDTVATTPRLSLSIPILNKYTQKFKSLNQTIYNLNDGAFFEDTVPLKAKDYKKKPSLNKKKLNIKLENLFNSYSISELSLLEIDKLKEKEQQVEVFLKFLDIFKNSASSNKDEFIHIYTELLQKILTSKVDELYEIMIVYFLKSAPYITDFFNTKKLDNPKKHTKKMKKITITQMEKIIRLYEENLLKAIKELIKPSRLA